MSTKKEVSEKSESTVKVENDVIVFEELEGLFYENRTLKLVFSSAGKPVLDKDGNRVKLPNGRDKFEHDSTKAPGVNLKSKIGKNKENVFIAGIDFYDIASQFVEEVQSNRQNVQDELNKAVDLDNSFKRTRSRPF